MIPVPVPNRHDSVLRLLRFTPLVAGGLCAAAMLALAATRRVHAVCRAAARPAQQARWAWEFYIHVFVWFDPAGTRPLNGRSGTCAARVPVGRTAGGARRLPGSSRRGWRSLVTKCRYSPTRHGGVVGEEKAVWCLATSWYSTGLVAGVHVSRSVKRIACDY